MQRTKNYIFMIYSVYTFIIIIIICISTSLTRINLWMSMHVVRLLFIGWHVILIYRSLKLTFSPYIHKKYKTIPLYTGIKRNTIVSLFIINTGSPKVTDGKWFIFNFLEECEHFRGRLLKPLRSTGRSP